MFSNFIQPYLATLTSEASGPQRLKPVLEEISGYGEIGQKGQGEKGQYCSPPLIITDKYVVTICYLVVVGRHDKSTYKERLR